MDRLRHALTAWAPLAAALALGVFYVVVLVLVRTPSSALSREYQMFYIDHELLHWPGDAGLETHLGEVIDFTRERMHADRNWTWLEHQGIWTKAGRAQVYLSLEGDRFGSHDLTALVEMQIAFPVTAEASQHVILAVDGARVGETTLPGTGVTQWRVIIPASSLRADAPTELSFKLPNCQRPGFMPELSHARCPGVMLRRLTLDASGN